MLTLRLDSEIETRLAALAQKTGRAKSYYVREAIMAHLEDMEDRYLAEQVLSRREKRWSQDEIEAEIGLDD